MNNHFHFQLAIALFSVHSSAQCMHLTTTKKLAVSHQRSFILTLKRIDSQEDKMAYYKQFCPTDNLQQTQPQESQKNKIPTHNHREDKMAYYKQFNTENGA